jgi:alpha-tubulin suppressor-like RCC1 family protein
MWRHCSTDHTPDLLWVCRCQPESLRDTDAVHLNSLLSAITHKCEFLFRVTGGLPGGEAGLVREVSCSTHHTVVVMASGEVCTFGSGNFGKLGHGDTMVEGLRGGD